MKMLLPFLILCAVAIVPIVAQAGEGDYVPGNNPAADVSGNGRVDAIDLGIVGSEFGQDYPPNPCVSWQVFDDTNQPTAYAIANSFGEIITPRGGYWLYDSTHPAYDAIRNGTPPPPPRACAP